MPRKKMPRLKNCVYCNKALEDPALDAPSARGRMTKHHMRCHRKAVRRAARLERRARLAWMDVPEGCRVSAKDYRKTNGKGAGHCRRIASRPRGLYTKQTCACGKSYYGGPAAVRCHICQAEHTRKLKRLWAAKNRTRNLAYMAKYYARRNLVVSIIALCMLYSRR